MTKVRDKYLQSIILGDAKEKLDLLEPNSVDVVLTDPPYFLDKLDHQWDPEKVNKPATRKAVVDSLPSGMRFDREQGKKFYSWYYDISQKIFKVLKPGGFFLSFSSPRLYHRLASAVDDAGFEVRDMFTWIYTQNQAKAMSLNHLIDKQDAFSFEEKTRLKGKLEGWKTPQVKSCFEPIVFAQKPTTGTYLKNMVEYEVGLINTAAKVGHQMFPSNVLTENGLRDDFDKFFCVSKPKSSEKGEFNTHKTVKPLDLCIHLLKLTCFSERAVVLDPFMGSGTTAIAALSLGKSFIGIELNEDYKKIADKRIAAFLKATKKTSIEDQLREDLCIS